MDAGHVGKAGVPCHVAGPEQQRQVHHAVDDGIAHPLRLVPGSDEARGIEAAHQQAGSVQGVYPGLFILQQLVMRAAGEQVHEAHVVVQALESPELLGEPRLGSQGLILEPIVLP